MHILKKKLRNLNHAEKQTFGLHSAHMFLEGIIDGALLLNEFILIKALFASNYQIGYLFQFSVVVLLFSVVFNEIIRRTVNKKRLLIWVGIITRLPLAVLFFFPSNASVIEQNPAYPLIFLSVFLFYYLYKPMILPTINLLLRHNYTSNHFGSLYSYATQIKKIVVIVTTFGFGLLLDFDNYAFTYIYPCLALLGIISIYLLSLINYTDTQPIITKSIGQSIKLSIIKMMTIIKHNKPYRDFEGGFMFYGFAWMATAAVITIFMEKHLHLNYSSIAFYKNSSNIVAIFLLPFFGKLLGKIDPRKFGIFTFFMLLLHLLFMLLTQYYHWNTTIGGFKLYTMLVLSFIFYGVFTASMALLWGIGSSYFCKNEDAGDYQSIHLTMVGLRSLFAPLIGVFFYELLGSSGTFLIGIASLFLAILLMFWSMKRYIL